MAHPLAQIIELPVREKAEHRPRIVALAFDSGLRAQEALLAVRGLEELGRLSVHDAVLLARDGEGRTAIVGTSDPIPVAAAVPGALFGALVGSILAGPPGFLVGGLLAGATSAVAGKLIDAGIPAAIVEQLRELTAPDHTVLAVLVSDVHEEAMVDELRRFQGAYVVYAELPHPTMERVRQVLAGAA